MAFKMDHKWKKGMYSGMAADKLEFIQKTGDGKSMAKQTEKKEKDPAKQTEKKEKDPNALSGYGRKGREFTNKEVKEYWNAPNEKGPMDEEIPKEDLDIIHDEDII